MGGFFSPCVLCRNRSRQEEVQKCHFGVSARRAVKHCTLSPNWPARNSTQNCVETREWKEQRNHSLWRVLVQFFGGGWKERGIVWEKKWEFSYFTEFRLVTQQILFHSGCLQVITITAGGVRLFHTPLVFIPAWHGQGMSGRSCRCLFGSVDN